MVGTTQANQTGADAGPDCKKMKNGTHKSVMCQHKAMPLVFATWSDNNIVKTLSNCHSPFFVEGGLQRRIKITNIQQQLQAPVNYPSQQVTYSDTFHLIDKGNGVESKYDMGDHRYVWTCNVM